MYNDQKHTVKSTQELLKANKWNVHGIVKPVNSVVYAFHLLKE